MKEHLPPDHLDDIGKAYWKKLVDEFGYDIKTEKLIELIAENYSVYRACQLDIMVNGVTIETSTTTKINPAVNAKSQSQTLIARLLKQLFSMIDAKPDTTLEDFFQEV